MKPTLLQAQIRAWIIGFLWFLPLAIFMQVVGSFGLIVLIGFPILVAFLTALITGPFDLLVIITCFVPSAYSFLMDIHMQMAHPVHGTVLSGTPITILLSLISAAVGIGLNRWLIPSSREILPLHTRRRFYFWFGFDLALLVFIPAILLTIDAYKISRQPTKEQLAQIEIQKLASPTTPDRERIRAMLELQGKAERSPEVVPALRKAFESESPSVKFAAAVFLLENGDVASLSYLEDRLMTSPVVSVNDEPEEIHTDWLGYGVGTPSINNYNLGSSLSQIHDRSAIPVLAHLLSSFDVEVRRGAASALRHLEASDAIDALLVAISDPDREVRYFAMGALMTATGDPHYPSMDLFYTNEAFYLDPWKAWARDRSQPPPRSRPF